MKRNIYSIIFLIVSRLVPTYMYSDNRAFVVAIYFFKSLEKYERCSLLGVHLILLYFSRN